MAYPVGVPRRDSALATLSALVIGGAAALGATVLLQLPLVWLGLVAVGLVIFIGSLVAADARRYWLTIFIASVPVNIAKLFVWNPEDVAVLKRQFGIYVNENMVPQMYLADLPLLMLLALWAAKMLASRRAIVVPRGLAPMAAFIVWCALLVPGERAPLFGATFVVYELKMVVMFLWFVNARLTRRDVQHAITVLMLSLMMQSGVVFYTYLAQTGENIWGSLFGARQSVSEDRSAPVRGSGAAYVFEQGMLRRGTGTMGTANLEAKYFVLILPFALVGTVAATRVLERWAAGAVLVIGLAALYLTYSRGGLLATGIALGSAAWLLARSRHLGWNRRTVVLGVVLVVAAGAVAAPFFLSFFGSRPQYTLSRVDHFVYGLQIWLQHPIAGVGINNFNLSVPRLDFGGAFDGAPIHNHYLRIAIETGVIGFALYFGFFAWLLRLAYRLTRCADPFVATTAIAVFAGLLGIAAYWMDDLFYDPIIRTQIWISAALIVVLARLAAAQEVTSAAAA